MGQRHERNGRGNIRTTDERSLDETALLAFGILLEEAARESLGKNGDLVFTEGVDDDELEDVNESEGQRPQQETPGSRRPHTPVGFQGEESFWKRKYSKRKKIQHEWD